VETTEKLSPNSTKSEAGGAQDGGALVRPHARQRSLVDDVLEIVIGAVGLPAPAIWKSATGSLTVGNHVTNLRDLVVGIID
jgi:hypothetical protein